jgi:membrane associated rhomboid family serine protease
MGRAIGCSRDELVAQFIVRGPAGIKLIWTPETPQPAFPETVPLLVPAFKRISIKAATSNIWVGLGLIAFGIVLALVTDDWSVLAGYLVFVGAIQVISAGGESISRAGLVKPAVWDGQLWRLLTACLMHGNWMHFWMNFLALLHFSKIVEQTRRPSYVPLIFLLSGACGSVFSVLLYPHTTSVGASGGLMGLLGFITVAAYFDKKTYPPKYLRNSIEAIAMIGVFGLIGFAFIDNAAHLGGLVGGLALGYVLVRPYNQRANAQNIEQQVAILGMVALVILGLVASLAIFKMLR